MVIHYEESLYQVYAPLPLPLPLQCLGLLVIPIIHTFTFFWVLCNFSETFWQPVTRKSSYRLETQNVAFQNKRCV